MRGALPRPASKPKLGRVAEVFEGRKEVYRLQLASDGKAVVFDVWMHKCYAVEVRRCDPILALRVLPRRKHAKQRERLLLKSPCLLVSLLRRVFIVVVVFVLPCFPSGGVEGGGSTLEVARLVSSLRRFHLPRARCARLANLVRCPAAPHRETFNPVIQLDHARPCTGSRTQE